MLDAGVRLLSIDVASPSPPGLSHVCDSGPAIRRRKAGRGFVYLDAKGRRIADPDIVRRIRSLVIPPAWTDVWICPSAVGHIQAIRRDAGGRKQCRYHADDREAREEAKHEHTLRLAKTLPTIRAARRPQVVGLRQGPLHLRARRLHRCATRHGEDGVRRERGRRHPATAPTRGPPRPQAGEESPIPTVEVRESAHAAKRRADRSKGGGGGKRRTTSARDREAACIRSGRRRGERPPAFQSTATEPAVQAPLRLSGTPPVRCATDGLRKARWVDGRRRRDRSPAPDRETRYRRSGCGTAPADFAYE